MKRYEILLYTLVTFFLTPGIARADVIMGWFAFSAQFFLVLCFIEAAFFWVYAGKVLNVRIHFLRILGVTILANILSYLFGLFLQFPYPEHIIISLAFIYTVLIEWGIFLLFFGGRTRGILDLLQVSTYINAISYLIFVIAYAAYLSDPRP